MMCALLFLCRTDAAILLGEVVGEDKYVPNQNEATVECKETML